MDHAKFMRRCLDLAAAGMGNTSPNPMVGAVVVHNGRIIGEGAHEMYGGPHAEVHAIRSVGKEDEHLFPESVLYVNLEPCNHTGKTPPCTELILQKKIGMVVIGGMDPNTTVAGGGAQHLKNAGVEVVTGILEEECRQLNKAFYCFYEKGRPYITLKFAQSADGFIAKKGGVPVHLTNAFSDELVQQLRREHMGLFVGGRTLINDNPRLTNRSGFGSQPVRLTLDTKNNLSSDLHFFDATGSAIVFNYEKNSSAGNVQFIRIPENNSAIKNMLQELTAKNINSLLVEGGAETLRAFIDSGAWDELLIFTTPVVLGEGITAPEPAGNLAEKIVIDDNILTRYRNT